MARSEGRTLRGFYQDIDQSVADSGITAAEVKRLQEISKHSDSREKLFELILPAYILLRNKGYSNKDLCS